MNARHRRTLKAIFTDPVPADIRWRDIEGLLVALGARVGERSGSRVSVVLRGIPAVYHRPHPRPEAKRGTVRAVRDQLIQAGIDESEEAP